MKYKVYKESDYKSNRWTGGQTTELAIYPMDRAYLERNFIWRLSSATIEKEESDFSRLSDYNRVLMVLDGEVVLSHEGQRVARLKTLEQDRFDGGFQTRSFGKITDFNLMVRKGNEGYLDVIYPASDRVTCTSTQESDKPKKVHALYCRDGYLVVTLPKAAQAVDFMGSCEGGEDAKPAKSAAGGAEETLMVQPGQLLVMEAGSGEDLTYGVMGEGTSIRAQIFFDEMEGELAAEVIPPEKTSFDDFKACIYLSNIQFRMAKYVIPSLKTQWFDEALSAAIRKVEKFYLTMAVFLAGCVLLGVASVNAGFSAAVTVIVFAAWLFVDCLIVSPLIYLPFMPKPVRKHIKDIDKLTPYEQRVRAEELGRNERLEKLLKKYKNSGRNMPE